MMENKTRPRRKRRAGTWLLRKMVLEIVVLSILLGTFLGMFLGMHTATLVPPRYFYMLHTALVVAICSLILCWRFKRYARGLEAERRVGDQIEWALTQPTCAVAHDLKEILQLSGNIDHIVLTPVGVWVIETKSHWLSEKNFPKALRQTANNTRHIQKHLNTSLPVRAALVIDEWEKQEQSYCKDYEIDGQTVTAFFAKDLRQQLRKECKQSLEDQKENTRVGKLIWQLGAIPSSDMDERLLKK